MRDYLFLYGTLLPSEATYESSRIVKGLKRVGSATVRGRLYDFGDYLGAVIDQLAKTSIKGELFELPNDDSALKALDEALFAKSGIAVEFAEGSGFNGVVDDVVRLNEMLFDKFFKEISDQFASRRFFNFFGIQFAFFKQDFAHLLFI